MGEVTQGHAPGLADCCVSAGHGDVFEVCCTFEGLKIRNQHLSAPNIAVGAIPGAVKSYPNDITSQMIFCHATGDVGMVMLYADLFHIPLSQSPLGRKVVGV